MPLCLWEPYAQQDAYIFLVHIYKTLPYTLQVQRCHGYQCVSPGPLFGASVLYTTLLIKRGRVVRDAVIPEERQPKRPHVGAMHGPLTVFVTTGNLRTGTNTKFRRFLVRNAWDVPTVLEAVEAAQMSELEYLTAALLQAEREAEAISVSAEQVKKNPYARRNKRLPLSLPQDRQRAVADLLRTAPSSWSNVIRSRGLTPSADPREIARRLLSKTAGGNEAGPEGPKTYVVPKEVAEDAWRGLVLSHDEDYAGWDGIGLGRAIQLVLEPKISRRAVARMQNFFSRNQRFKRFVNEGSPYGATKSEMAWLNWGGTAGERWVNTLR
jgi:hypothetical protein